MLNKKPHEKNIILDELIAKLSVFSLEKRRLNCLSQILLGLMTVQIVTLSAIGSFLSGTAKLTSKIERVERFIRQIKFNEGHLAEIIVEILKLKKLILVIDRTCWKQGSKFLNFLVLSVDVNGTAVPILWKLLDKEGNSELDCRKSLLNKCIEIFGFKRIDFILGDREFNGKEWLKYLLNNRIDFCMRIKKNTLINGKRAEIVLCSLKGGKSIVLRGKKKVLGLEAYICGSRNKKGELMILLSSMRSKVLKKYRQRWSIEVSFKQLKSDGFDLEKTGIKDSERLKTLCSLLSLAAALVVANGKHLEKRSVREIKKHGYKAISLFKLGIEELRHWILNCELFIKNILAFIHSITISKVLYRT